jgi:hypothetical protein
MVEAVVGYDEVVVRYGDGECLWKIGVRSGQKELKLL